MNIDQLAIEGELVDLMARIGGIDRSKFERGISLSDAGVDSLQLVEAIFVIEEKYGISIPFNANEQAAGSSHAAFQTVGDLLDLVVNLVLAKDNAEITLASA